MKKNSKIVAVMLTSLIAVAAMISVPAKATGVYIGSIVLQDGGAQNNQFASNLVMDAGLVGTGAFNLYAGNTYGVQCVGPKTNTGPIAFCYQTSADAGVQLSGDCSNNGLIVPTTYVTSNPPYKILMPVRQNTLTVQTAPLADAGLALGQCNVFMDVVPRGTGQAQ